MRKIRRFFDVIVTDEPPAPEAAIEMSLSKCKTDCSTMRCKCKENSLGCTEMCLRTGYENITVDKDLERQIVHDDGKDNGI